MKDKKKKIFLTGGGTGGSVTPLLALAEELGSGEYDFLWLGTKSGPEREMVGRAGIEFKSIQAGKWRRYWSLKNFIDPFLVLVGLIRSLFIILSWRPDLIISAGSFVSVPVAFAGRLCRVPIIIHQQDARPGLANKLAAPLAKVVTVTFKKSLADYGPKAVWTGNPIRRSLKIRNQKSEILNSSDELPTVLIMGGGTGARAINELVAESLPELTKFCDIIHVTGKNKTGNRKLETGNYKFFEFLNVDELAQAYVQADLVVSRAGMGVLTELSYLGKPTIIIPIPKSHQEDNAAIFAQAEAAVVFKQKELTPELFVKTIFDLFANKSELARLSANISQVIKRDAGQEMVGVVKRMLGEK